MIVATKNLKDPQVIWMLIILALIVWMTFCSGCNMFTPAAGRATHERTTTEYFDGTVVTEERVEIVQPEGSKEATSYTVTNEPFSLTGVFGSQYDWESIKQKYNAMKPFIWSGISVLVLSVFCMVKSWCSSKVGWAGVAAGAGLAFFGTLMPTYGGYVFWGFAATAVGLVAYILWRHGKW